MVLGAPARLHPAEPPGLALRRHARHPAGGLDQLRARRSASRSPSCSPAWASPAWCTPRATWRASAVSAGRAEPVFAGESAQFRLYLDGRAALRPARDPRAPPRLGRAAAWSTSPPARRRGGARGARGAARLAPLGRVMLETRFPLGLFRAWSYVEPDARCLVYPRPERRALPPPSAEAAAGGLRAQAAGQRRLLRAARLPAHRLAAPRGVEGGGAQRRHAHQAVHRRGGGRAVARLARCCPPARSEQRLSRLAGWVLAAERDGARYGLRLPGRRDRARPRRRAPRRLPAGAGALRMSAEPMRARPAPALARAARGRRARPAC